MAKLSSFRAIIDLWASKEAMASIIGANGSQVSKWWQRDSIPAEWWSSILSTPVARSEGLTPDLLTRLAARETAESRR